MKPGSLNRLKDTKKAFQITFPLLFSLSALPGSGSGGGTATNSSTTCSFHSWSLYTALKSLYLCRPEGLVCLTTALLSLQQHSGACCRDLCLFRVCRATAHLPQRFYQFLRILQLLRDEVPKPWGCPPSHTPCHAELSCLRADLLVIFLNGCLIRNIT